MGFTDQATDKRYQFLTNRVGLSAFTMAAVYKDRWQVKMFFEANKQYLEIKGFVDLSKNAILTQMMDSDDHLLVACLCPAQRKTG
ncbi:MAG: IS4 transposase [Paracoccaceae bacterium]